MKQNKGSRPQTSGPKPQTKGRINVETVSYQNLIQPHLKNVSIISQKILCLLGLPFSSISIVFCDDKFISKLNSKFFKKSKATDVISFPLQDTPMSEYLGEVVISIEQAKKMCDFYGKKWQEELVLYLIHGILHLVGYDDIKKKERMIMEQKQEEILSKLIKKHDKIINRLSVS